MTSSQALAFLKHVAEDETLSQQVRQGGTAGIESVAREAGYECSLDEIKNVIAQVRGESMQLSDDMLDAVAGGLNTTDLSTFIEDLSSFDDLL